MPARAAVRTANPWTTHDVLRIGVFRDIDSINPLLSGQAATNDIAQLIFSGLLGYDDRGNLIPDVALAVPTLANGGINADLDRVPCLERSRFHREQPRLNGRRPPFRRARRFERSLPALGEFITRRAPSAAI